jgi:radical SAM superfamily enzyme YgiQ (UPF0313 family)
MNKRILLLSFSIQKKTEIVWRGLHYNPALGIASLSSWLELNGYEVFAIDVGYSTYTFQKILRLIREKDPFLIGVSLYTENYKMGLSFIKLIKEEMPMLRFVVGGPHPSLCPEDFVLDENIDYICIYEGESTLLELAEAISVNKENVNHIDGIIYKDGNKVIRNKSRKRISDLDLLPIPKREVFGIENYETVVTISTSRGCPAKCIYCAATTLSGATYRYRSIESIALEMVYLLILRKDVVKRFFVIDDTFTERVDRVYEFAKIVEQYNLNMIWQCESRVDAMNEQLLEVLEKSKCFQIQYGIESGSQDVLNKIRKGINLDEAKNILRLTHEKGITICLSFILGHYCDTLDTMQETYEFIVECYEKYRPEIYVSFNTPFPKTWQHSNAKKLGMRFVTENLSYYTLQEPIVETENFSIHDQMNFMKKMDPYVGFRKRRMLRKEEVSINV